MSPPIYQPVNYGFPAPTFNGNTPPAMPVPQPRGAGGFVLPMTPTPSVPSRGMPTFTVSGNGGPTNAWSMSQGTGTVPVVPQIPSFTNSAAGGGRGFVNPPLVTQTPMEGDYMNSMMNWSGNGLQMPSNQPSMGYSSLQLPEGFDLYKSPVFDVGVSDAVYNSNPNSNGWMPEWLEGAIGTKDSPGWGGFALGAANTAANLFFGMQQYGLAKKTLAENKRQFQLNYDAQKQTTNSALEDRQRARVASNPGAYESVGSYMDRNKVK